MSKAPVVWRGVGAAQQQTGKSGTQHFETMPEILIEGGAQRTIEKSLRLVVVASVESTDQSSRLCYSVEDQERAFRRMSNFPQPDPVVDRFIPSKSFARERKRLRRELCTVKRQKEGQHSFDLTRRDVYLLLSTNR